MLNLDDSFILYTDGSCWTGDKVGAYAWVAIDSEDNYEIQGLAEKNTTISRMELLGAISGLEFLLEKYGPSVVLIQSDSQYVVFGAMDRSRKRRKNQDLWKRLDLVVDSHELAVFEHVKGHSDHVFNDMVDRLAGELRVEAQ